MYEEVDHDIETTDCVMLLKINIDAVEANDAVVANAAQLAETAWLEVPKWDPVMFPETEAVMPPAAYCNVGVK